MGNRQDAPHRIRPCLVEGLHPQIGAEGVVFVADDESGDIVAANKVVGTELPTLRLREQAWLLTRAPSESPRTRALTPCPAI